MGRLGFVIGIVGFILLVITAYVLLPPTLRQSGVGQTLVAGTSIYGFLLLIPITIAIAILRSRLYDIDVVINRALVYGSLTGLLGALSAGLIIGLASLVGLFGGTAAQNPVALVISTLVIAALFLPARRRIQAIIDRRFYRRKYGAEKRWRLSAPRCARRPIWSRSTSGCWRWCRKPCGPRRPPSGCGNQNGIPQIRLTT